MVEAIRRIDVLGRRHGTATRGVNAEHVRQLDRVLPMSRLNAA
jgi:hypothetical protein